MLVNSVQYPCYSMFGHFSHWLCTITIHMVSWHAFHDNQTVTLSQFSIFPEVLITGKGFLFVRGFLFIGRQTVFVCSLLLLFVEPETITQALHHTCKGWWPHQSITRYTPGIIVHLQVVMTTVASTASNTLVIRRFNWRHGSAHWLHHADGQQ